MEVKPGYKQTEVGVIPEDWDVKQLGTLVTYTNGKAHEQSISNSGRYVVANSKFISSEGETRKYSEHCFCPTLKGDVLMVMSDVPNGRAIAKCYCVERDKTYTVNQRICALTPRGIDGKLLFYKLDRNPFYLAFDDGAKQTNLRKDEVLACPLGIPKSGDEQRAIAGALSDVNALIGGLNQLIAKKRELKQAAMQQLLTGDKRLRGFHGEWETKRLGDVADVFKGVGLSKAALSVSGPRKCILYGELFTTYGRVITDVASRTNASDGRLSQTGDVIVPGSTTTEGIDLATASALIVDDVALGGDINIVRRNGAPRYDAVFLANYLTHAKKSDIADRAQGITIIHLYGRDLLDLSMDLPSLPEQTAIAAVVSDMDAELAALGQRLTKTHALKQAMRQALLTGRTRLV